MTATTDKLPGLADILGRWLNRKPKEDDLVEQTSPDTVVENATTGGGHERKPVVVWTAPHQLEARIVQGRLESEGVPAMIQGDAMGDILGIASGGLAETDVLVPAPLVDKALEILQSDEAYDGDDGPDTGLSE